MSNYIEWMGYLASFSCVISLLMSSIKRLRWTNLFASALFTTYGLFIKAYPIALANFSIVVIDIYYLVKMYNEEKNQKKQFNKVEKVVC